MNDTLLEQHGLTRDEYGRIVEILGREPTLTELGMFSVMWSEHCSYKSSRLHLKKLPTAGPRVLQGPGENAGAVEIGDGLAAVFKIESHNHPSFIEPYQGAATGVGGIIRDIFTMGARPIALMDSLRFGTLGSPLTRRIVHGVVAGIAGYGNSIGIPVVGGEAVFDACYAANPVVNVFCLGIARTDHLVKGRADGVGNPVYYVGAKTGRDGIHGATMASAEFDEQSSSKRPNVQVGDPFMEKLLLEACLEVLRSGALIGLQDMGAAGLTCATSEMSARARTGMDVEVTAVPQRETGMTPYEIMLSESQERMLFVVKTGREADVEQTFEKWDLHAVKIGVVTDDGMVRVRERGTAVVEIPAAALADEAPLYDRPYRKPQDFDAERALGPEHLRPAPAAPDVFLALLASPTIASKRWIFRQYDHMVRTNTLVLPGMGTAVVRVKGTKRALAMSLDGNGRYGQLDPRRGAILAVAEAARNVACAGGVPIGATNNLNFGNPERPEIMWQLVEAIEGMAEACRALDIPITGGNVSLYNETEGRPIYPTPVLGVVGLIEDGSKVVGRAFPEPDLSVVLVGARSLVAEIGGSEYLHIVHGQVRGVPPAVDLEAERALHRLLPRAIQDGIVRSAHDVAEGGLAVALAECCFENEDIGVKIDLGTLATEPSPDEGWTPMPADHSVLFGEAAGRVLVTVRREDEAAFLARAEAEDVCVRVIGRTGGNRVSIDLNGRAAIDEPVREAETVWATALERALASRAA
ncbi:MAG: phosphoribosylformylglycinamidine synthase subunit PurL [Luteitalea sp.]|nr:phosphoribosylformylglycinamidine synthase subunit PurL [Luteitalea sp.]